MEIPKGHQTVMPYLILNGAEKFKKFAESVFDAKQSYYQPDESGGIRHAEILIYGSTIMFADSTDQWTALTASMYVYVENADEVYAKALKNGASSLMEPSDQNYGRSCGVKDPLGNVWWITSNVKNVH